MDKNKFWLGGRLFNTASPRFGAPTQRKARPQDGRPNATQGTSASWAPQRKAGHVRKSGAPTHVRNANARHVRKFGAPTQRKARPQDGCPNATQGTSASWAPQRKAGHIRKLGAPTHIRNSNARHFRTSASWAPQRNARHVRKMGAQTQRKASSQDGRPNEKLIRNENVHTREH
jgi:hypothetical protein